MRLLERFELGSSLEIAKLATMSGQEAWQEVRSICGNFVGETFKQSNQFTQDACEMLSALLRVAVEVLSAAEDPKEAWKAAATEAGATGEEVDNFIHLASSISVSTDLFRNVFGDEWPEKEHGLFMALAYSLMYSAVFMTLDEWDALRYDIYNLHVLLGARTNPFLRFVALEYTRRHAPSSSGDSQPLDERKSQDVSEDRPEKNLNLQEVTSASADAPAWAQSLLNEQSRAQELVGRLRECLAGPEGAAASTSSAPSKKLGFQYPLQLDCITKDHAAAKRARDEIKPTLARIFNRLSESDREEARTARDKTWIVSDTGFLLALDASLSEPKPTTLLAPQSTFPEPCGAGSGVTGLEITLAERHFGFEMPAELRALYMATNGMDLVHLRLSPLQLLLCEYRASPEHHGFFSRIQGLPVVNAVAGGRWGEAWDVYLCNPEDKDVVVSTEFFQKLRTVENVHNLFRQRYSTQLAAELELAEAGAYEQAR